MELETYTAKIYQTMMETEEEFIFQTIAPYCQTLTEMRITKQTLIDALRQYKRLEEENKMLKEELKQRGVIVV